MLKPFLLADHQFANNIIQGPLAGISNAPFRVLTHQYGAPAFTCTEMLSSKTLQHAPASLLKRFLKKDNREGRVCYQISGTDPADIAEATKIVTQAGADILDLNCGCPVSKIRKRGAGSALLSQADNIFRLITAMKNNTHIPVAIKIRVDGNSADNFNAEICKMICDSGLDLLTVHGRHWTEHYESACNYEQITYFVEHLSIPVVGNGDIQCLASLSKMYETGCAAVMIGRAGIGQPWLAQQLLADYRGEAFTVPELHIVKEIFLRHIQGLAELLESEARAVMQARRLAKHYFAAISDYLVHLESINQCLTLVELTQCINTIARRDNQ
jgi:tRNA-dihydrouridine synthase B